MIFDLGIFINAPHYPYKIQALEMDVRETIYPKLEAAHQKELNFENAKKLLNDNNLSEIELTFLEEMFELFPPANLNSLQELLEYIKYIHGKFYYLDENLIDKSLP